MNGRQIVTDERATDLIARADWTAGEALDLLHTRRYAILALEDVDELIQDTRLPAAKRVELSHDMTAAVLKNLRGTAEETKPSPERST